ncbi:GNAT family N-acetyltransferase [uncultured Allomuricauda sp.]|uniref:GNAT family N-acetyltransferase n=1 Tax=Flagellimonas sp. W118 TaxID=3410791 RepID=UPI002630B7CD|nr:GNAT family N-acetyltransferase [uncultured Allomuricauda sp.]
MEISRATPSDATIIALLARITFTETFGHYFEDKSDLENYLDHTFNVKKLKSSLTNPNNLYWLAYLDELPVGYAKLKLNSPSSFLNESELCQLQKIYVLKDFLSKKIGLALQNVLLEEAKSKAPKIWLSVLKENVRAIRFYEKNGFEKIGDHDFQIGKEHFEFQAMVKSLQ